MPCEVCGQTMNAGSLIGHVWSQHRAGESRPAHRSRAHGYSALDEAYRGLIG